METDKRVSSVLLVVRTVSLLTAFASCQKLRNRRIKINNDDNINKVKVQHQISFARELILLILEFLLILKRRLHFLGFIISRVVLIN